MIKYITIIEILGSSARKIDPMTGKTYRRLEVADEGAHGRSITSDLTTRNAVGAASRDRIERRPLPKTVGRTVVRGRAAPARQSTDEGRRGEQERTKRAKHGDETRRVSRPEKMKVPSRAADGRDWGYQTVMMMASKGGCRLIIQTKS